MQAWLLDSSWGPAMAPPVFEMENSLPLRRGSQWACSSAMMRSPHTHVSLVLLSSELGRWKQHLGLCFLLMGEDLVEKVGRWDLRCHQYRKLSDEKLPSPMQTGTSSNLQSERATLGLLKIYPLVTQLGLPQLRDLGPGFLGVLTSTLPTTLAQKQAV